MTKSRDGDGGLLVCYSLDQNSVVDTYLASMLLGAVFIGAVLFFAWRAANSRQSKTVAEESKLIDGGSNGEEAIVVKNGPDRARLALVFPIYTYTLWVTLILLIARGFLLRFLPRSSIGGYGIAYLGVVNGLTAAAREGLALFFVQRNVGRDALRRAGFVAALWGFCQGLMGVNFYLSPSKDHIYLHTNTYYFLSHDASICLVELGLFTTMLFRSNERIGLGHLLYTGYFVVIFSLFVVGDLGNIFEAEWYGCLSLVTEFLLYSFWALITYIAIRADSNYWRSVGDSGGDSRHYSTSTSKWLFSRGRTGDPNLDPVNDPTEGLLNTELRANVGRVTTVLDFTEVQMKSVIGVGGSASVFRGTYRGIPIAIKKFHGGSLSQAEIRKWAREVKMNATLQHRNIVRLYGVCVVLPSLLLVCELAERGSLFDVLQKVGDSLARLSLGRRLRMMRDCAAGLAVLHEQFPPIVHIDLKSLNYLVDSKYVVKLADFGETRVVSNESLEPHEAMVVTKSLVQSTVNWMAPESFRHQFTTKSDVYSLGCVLAEIISGRPPFDAVEQFRIGTLVVDEKRRPTLPTHCPQHLRAIIELCWEHDPRRRPACAAVLTELEQLVRNDLDRQAAKIFS